MFRPDDSAAGITFGILTVSRSAFHMPMDFLGRNNPTKTVAFHLIAGIHRTAGICRNHGRPDRLKHTVCPYRQGLACPAGCISFCLLPAQNTGRINDWTQNLFPFWYPRYRDARLQHCIHRLFTGLPSKLPCGKLRHLHGHCIAVKYASRRIGSNPVCAILCNHTAHFR